jgi:hypothetical protein
MTMEPNHHPDDERLAALAGGEPDVELRLHLRGCARCSSIVDELAVLRSALAELPDLAPSRPLQLIPEVAEPQPSAAERLAGWTRRAFMPLLAAGFGLAIVGSVGTVGSTFNMGSSGAAPALAPASRDLSTSSTPAEGGAAAASASATTDGAAAAPGSSKAASPMPGFVAQSASGGAIASPAGSSAVAESATASPASARAESPSASPAAERGNAFEQSPPSTPRSLWPMVLFAGLALIVGTLLLRWIVQPRAG